MPDHTYTARFGWTPKDLIMLPACALFVVLGTVLIRDGELGGIVICLIGGAYIVLSVMALLSRRVALAVTAEGITLGEMPPWPARYTAFVPWSDIEAVILWRQNQVRRTSARFIGVARRADAPPLPGSAKSATLRKLNKAVVPGHLSEGLVADSRQISFWHLNKKRLTDAVHHFRPDVRIVDET